MIYNLLTEHMAHICSGWKYLILSEVSLQKAYYFLLTAMASIPKPLWKWSRELVKNNFTCSS